MTMEYFRPNTKEDLVALLKIKNENTYFAAGCTDLMIQFREKKIYHYNLIDLTQMRESRDIYLTEEAIHIGAFVTAARLEESPVIKSLVPALAQAAGMLGSTQIRNLATIGGNLGNASQSADLIPVLAACGAVIILLNSKEKLIEYSIDELITGSGLTSLKQDEVIWRIRIPKSSRLSAFYKVGARKSVTISKINGCLSAELLNGQIKNPVIYLGAVGRKALRAPLVEAVIDGKRLEDYLDIPCGEVSKKQSEYPMEQLKLAVEEQIEANIPDRPSKHYKKKAAFGLMLNMIEELKVQNGQKITAGET